jgi:hypothetical protein
MKRLLSCCVLLFIAFFPWYTILQAQKDTPEVRRLIEELVNNKKNYRGPDHRGHHWFSNILENGEQLWAKVEGSTIKNAGINKIPQPHNATTGLCKAPSNTKL